MEPSLSAPEALAAAALCETAARGFELDGMALWAAAAFRRHGEIAGGDEGSRRIADADAEMIRRKVARPDRMAAFLAPGFDGVPRALPP